MVENLDVELVSRVEHRKLVHAISGVTFVSRVLVAVLDGSGSGACCVSFYLGSAFIKRFSTSSTEYHDSWPEEQEAFYLFSVALPVVHLMVRGEFDGAAVLQDSDAVGSMLKKRAQSKWPTTRRPLYELQLYQTYRHVLALLMPDVYCGAGCPKPLSDYVWDGKPLRPALVPPTCLPVLDVPHAHSGRLPAVLPVSAVFGVSPVRPLFLPVSWTQIPSHAFDPKPVEISRDLRCAGLVGLASSVLFVQSLIEHHHACIGAPLPPPLPPGMLSGISEFARAANTPGFFREWKRIYSLCLDVLERYRDPSGHAMVDKAAGICADHKLNPSPRIVARASIKAQIRCPTRKGCIDVRRCWLCPGVVDDSNKMRLGPRLVDFPRRSSKSLFPLVLAIFTNAKVGTCKCGAAMTTYHLLFECERAATSAAVGRRLPEIDNFQYPLTLCGIIDFVVKNPLKILHAITDIDILDPIYTKEVAAFGQYNSRIAQLENHFTKMTRKMVGEGIHWPKDAGTGIAELKSIKYENECVRAANATVDENILAKVSKRKPVAGFLYSQEDTSSQEESAGRDQEAARASSISSEESSDDFADARDRFWLQYERCVEEIWDGSDEDIGRWDAISDDENDSFHGDEQHDSDHNDELENDIASDASLGDENDHYHGDEQHDSDHYDELGNNTASDAMLGDMNDSFHGDEQHESYHNGELGDHFEPDRITRPLGSAASSSNSTGKMGKRDRRLSFEEQAPDDSALIDPSFLLKRQRRKS